MWDRLDTPGLSLLYVFYANKKVWKQKKTKRAEIILTEYVVYMYCTHTVQYSRRVSQSWTLNSCCVEIENVGEKRHDVYYPKVNQVQFWFSEFSAFLKSTS